MNTSIDDKKVEKISKALSDPYRIKIMQAIREEKDWLQCQAITQMFNLAQSTVSHHINQLVDADLLHAEKDGRHAPKKLPRQLLSLARINHPTLFTTNGPIGDALARLNYRLAHFADKLWEKRPTHLYLWST